MTWNRGPRTGLKPLVDYAAPNERKLSTLVYCPEVNGDPIATCDTHASAIKHRDTVLGIRGGHAWIEIFPRFENGPAPRCDLKDYLVAK